ncbi:MAG: ATP-binding protein, partial [Candidatus Paceibacterota bacterium]
MNQFTFNISLSVLNHLGRNLYRSFITVLGEAISNSWDADAENVHIYIDRKNRCLIIKDDGIGMSENDFQNHFLKIGYSKRKEGITKSIKGRPFIGRKGIGKLAMLSCAKRVTVISKVDDGEYVGGCIDNSGLDEAIQSDLTPDQYELGDWSLQDFEEYTQSHNRGTIIRFDGLHDGIKNTIEYLKKIIALNFRFSLVLENDQFDIYLNDEKISIDHLSDLADKTSYLWEINDLDDPYTDEKLTKPPLQRDSKKIEVETNIQGFIASVEKPSNLKILTTNERVSIDLFVNGRLREKDILKHIPTTRIVESYLYG